mgnify:CR=1 FL=1
MRKLIGSGKSTAGRIASEVFGRELIDIDALVEKNAKMSIPEIFDKVNGLVSSVSEKMAKKKKKV